MKRAITTRKEGLGVFYSYGKPYWGKPYLGKPYLGKPLGYPASKASGFTGAVPATSVVTSPYPI